MPRIQHRTKTAVGIAIAVGIGSVFVPACGRLKSFLRNRPDVINERSGATQSTPTGAVSAVTVTSNITNSLVGERGETILIPAITPPAAATGDRLVLAATSQSFAASISSVVLGTPQGCKVTVESVGNGPAPSINAGDHLQFMVLSPKDETTTTAAGHPPFGMTGFVSEFSSGALTLPAELAVEDGQGFCSELNAAFENSQIVQVAITTQPRSESATVAGVTIDGTSSDQAEIVAITNGKYGSGSQVSYPAEAKLRSVLSTGAEVENGDVVLHFTGGAISPGDPVVVSLPAESMSGVRLDDLKFDPTSHLLTSMTLSGVGTLPSPGSTVVFPFLGAPVSAVISAVSNHSGDQATVVLSVVAPALYNGLTKGLDGITIKRAERNLLGVAVSTEQDANGDARVQVRGFPVSDLPPAGVPVTVFSWLSGAGTSSSSGVAATGPQSSTQRAVGGSGQEVGAATILRSSPLTDADPILPVIDAIPGGNTWIALAQDMKPIPDAPRPAGAPDISLLAKLDASVGVLGGLPGAGTGSLCSTPSTRDLTVSNWVTAQTGCLHFPVDLAMGVELLYHDSYVGTRTPIGSGWVMSFESEIDMNSDGTAILQTPEGKTTFVTGPSGILVSEDGRLWLAQSGGHYVLFDRASNAGATFDPYGSHYLIAYTFTMGGPSGSIQAFATGRIERDPTTGLPISMRDAFAGRLDFGYQLSPYDGLPLLNAVTQTVNPDPFQAIARNWNITYDKNGRLVSLYYPAAVEYGVQEFSYGGTGLLLAQTYDVTTLTTLFLREIGGSRVVQVNQQFGGRELLENSTNLTYGASLLVSDALGTGDWTSYQFDNLKRLTMMATSNGDAINQTYDGTSDRVAQNVTIPSGIGTQYTYDATGNISKVQRLPDLLPMLTVLSRQDLWVTGVVTAGSPLETDYTYDAIGRPTSMSIGGVVQERMVFLSNPTDPTSTVECDENAASQTSRVCQTLDGRGQLTGVTSDNGLSTLTIQRDDTTDAPTSVALTAGGPTIYSASISSWNSLMQPTLITSLSNGQQDTTTLAYSLAGQQTYMSSSLENVARTMAYANTGYMTDYEVYPRTTPQSLISGLMSQ